MFLLEFKMDVLVKVSFLSVALTSSPKVELEEAWYNKVRIGDTINATVAEDFPTTWFSYCSMRFLNVIQTERLRQRQRLQLGSLLAIIGN